MLEARCMPSVSLTVRYLSSPGTVTTTMGMMTEIREILYRTKKFLLQFSSDNSLQDSPRMQPQDLQQPGVCRPPLSVRQPRI